MGKGFGLCGNSDVSAALYSSVHFICMLTNFWDELISMQNVEPEARGDMPELILNPNVHRTCGCHLQSREIS